MKRFVNILILSIITTCLCASLTFAGSFTQKDRELLIRLEERLNGIDKRFEQIDKRFEQVAKRIEELREDMNKRFEQVDKRIEELRQDTNKRFEELMHDMNKRFEQVDKRFQEQNNLMMVIIGAFAAIVAATIVFAIWDRRTMIRPFEDKVKKIESDISMGNKKLEKLIAALQEYAKKNEEVAKILRTFSLL